jgi:hypothetical protein
MFMQEFEKWRLNHSVFEDEIDQDVFEEFFQDYFCGQSIMEVLAELAFQIYEAQICIEGLLEENG